MRFPSRENKGAPSLYLPEKEATAGFVHSPFFNSVYTIFCGCELPR